MTQREACTQSGSLRASAALVVVFVVLDTLVRWPGYSTAGFASHDVAGITYNGLLLGRGQLPYVDSVELKAPLTFYLSAGLHAWSGGPGLSSVNSLIGLANAFATLSMASLVGLAGRAWGWGSGLVVALLALLFAPVLDSMDANYVTWANAFAIWALVACWWGTRSGFERKLAPWVVAGLLAGACALSKRPVAAFAPAMFVFAGVSADGRRWARRSSGLALGLCLAHLPFLLHYAAAGEAAAFVRGYLLNEWGSAYIAQRRPGLGSALAEGGLASVHFVGLPLLLAAYALPRALRDADARDKRWLYGLTLWALSLWAAAFVGFRFYKGYFAPLLAPLLILAAHPSGAVGLVAQLRESSRARLVALALLVMVAPFAYRSVRMRHATRIDRARQHDAGGRAIAEFVAPQLQPGDRIWVWGWHLWDVYTYADAPSASRIYKSLGLLTPPNDDTWRGGGSPQRFVDGQPASMLLSDFERTPPRFIVLGSTVPRARFSGLQELLRRRYRRVRGPRLGRVQYWELRD